MLWLRNSAFRFVLFCFNADKQCSTKAWVLRCCKHAFLPHWLRLGDSLIFFFHSLKVLIPPRLHLRISAVASCFRSCAFGLGEWYGRPDHERAICRASHCPRMPGGFGCSASPGFTDFARATTSNLVAGPVWSSGRFQAVVYNLLVCAIRSCLGGFKHSFFG